MDKGKRMDNKYKCLWASTCSYYESSTNYDEERIKCTNTDCILYGMEKSEGESNDE